MYSFRNVHVCSISIQEQLQFSLGLILEQLQNNSQFTYFIRFQRLIRYEWFFESLYVIPKNDIRDELSQR